MGKLTGTAGTNVLGEECDGLDIFPRGGEFAAGFNEDDAAADSPGIRTCLSRLTERCNLSNRNESPLKNKTPSFFL